MTETMPPPDAARASRAVGAMFFSGFGAAWLALWARSEFQSLLPMAAVVLAAAVLLGLAYRVYRANAPALRASRNSPASMRRSRVFGIVNIAQWAAIFVVSLLLSRTGHAEFILPAVVFIVGLHFIPLARLFSYRPHYLTGTALMLLAAVYPFIGTAGPKSDIGALGAGVILCLSAVWAIVPRRRSVPRVA